MYFQIIGILQFIYSLKTRFKISVYIWMGFIKMLGNIN
jgi:hypothetical protein